MVNILTFYKNNDKNILVAISIVNLLPRKGGVSQVKNIRKVTAVRGWWASRHSQTQLPLAEESPSGVRRRVIDEIETPEEEDFVHGHLVGRAVHKTREHVREAASIARRERVLAVLLRRVLSEKHARQIADEVDRRIDSLREFLPLFRQTRQEREAERSKKPPRARS